MSMRHWILYAGLLVSTAAGAAGVKVDNAWTRATAPGQKVGGAFVTLTADADAALVGAASSLATEVELHSMAMDKGVMVMRRMERIDLPKGKAVTLEPGGLHIMLFGLKGPLKAGERVPLTLTVRDAKGKTQQIKVSAEVREMGMMRGH